MCWSGSTCGIAADLPEGLFVPVLRNVGKRDAADLRAGLDRMRADIVARTIAPEEMRGNTITLSNFGMIAGATRRPSWCRPRCAILGAGRVRDEAVAAGGQPAVHRVMPLSADLRPPRGHGRGGGALPCAR